MKAMSAILAGLFLLALSGQAAAAPDTACAALIDAAPEHVTITTARSFASVAAGRMARPDQARPQSAYCEVTGIIAPVAGSRIGFTLWLPAPGIWNDRLKMFGNGGYGSSLPERQMAPAVDAGYAVTATDTGHQGDDPDFVVGHPQALVDWGHRAVHETVQAAKLLVAHYYDETADYTYFEGCSTGGHQAFSEVQRYPEDFNGVIAGAPGHNRIRLNTAFLWQFVVNRSPDSPGTVILPASKLPLLTAEARRQCDGDPATDWIDDPLACSVDLGQIACEGDETEACLTPAQIEVARTMYGGATNPRTGERIYPGWLPGSESGGPVPQFLPGWSLYWADPAYPADPARLSFWKFWAFDDPSWDWQSFDFDRDVSRTLDRLADIVDATQPDISAFRDGGGKLLHYHGLDDPVVSPTDSVTYHNAVVDTLGGDVSDFYRLFLLPGVEHCRGGPGPDRFDAQAVIEEWVEQGSPPDGLNVRHSGDEGETALSYRLSPYTE